MKLFSAMRRWWLAVVRPWVARTLVLESLLSEHWVHGVENQGSGAFYFTGWKYDQARDGAVAQWIYCPPVSAKENRRYYVCIPSYTHGTYCSGMTFDVGTQVALFQDDPELIRAHVAGGFVMIVNEVTKLWPQHFALHNTRIRR